jgi:hypothetical protein
VIGMVGQLLAAFLGDLVLRSAASARQSYSAEMTRYLAERGFTRARVTPAS